MKNYLNICSLDIINLKTSSNHHAHWQSQSWFLILCATCYQHFLPLAFILLCFSSNMLFSFFLSGFIFPKISFESLCWQKISENLFMYQILCTSYSCSFTMKLIYSLGNELSFLMWYFFLHILILYTVNLKREIMY